MNDTGSSLTTLAGPQQSNVGERQMKMKNIFVEHDRFLDAWKFIERSHRPVLGGVHDHGTISALIGESRAGKTSVATRYMKKHPPSIADGVMHYPVLYVNIPMDGQRALLTFVGDALGLKYSLRINNPTLQTMIIKGLKEQRVELLIFDEVNTVVADGNRRAITYALNLFRKLVDLCGLNVLCIGLEETYGLLAADSQISGRGGLPYHEVQPYSWDSEEERKLFRLLCDEFDRRLPFNERSNLQSSWCAHRLFYSSKNGIIGRLSNFLYRAGCLALNENAESVQAKHFAEAYETIKERGVEFNPWVHDLSRAPIPKKTEASFSGSSPGEVFAKSGTANAT